MRLGIVGATGVVGEMALRILQQKSIEPAELRLFASARSAGRLIDGITVEDAESADYSGLDVVITSIGSDVAKKLAPQITGAGAVVVDNSSAFRMDADVPLVIPGVNGEAAHERSRNIIANPNCTTAVALMALAPIHREFGLASLITTSFQSVSGTGREAVDELLQQVPKALNQIDALYGLAEADLGPTEVYSHPLAFNAFPHCESFDGDTSTEEAKMGNETRKILDAPDITVHATAVRVPVVVGHSVSITASLSNEASPERIRKLLESSAGVEVLDDPSNAVYPTPLACAGRDEVLVGRIRSNPVVPNGISLFVCGDNLRRGAALNALEIAQLVTS